MKKRLFVLLFLIMSLFSLALSGCGKKDIGERLPNRDIPWEQEQEAEIKENKENQTNSDDTVHSNQEPFDKDKYIEEQRNKIENNKLQNNKTLYEKLSKVDYLSLCDDTIVSLDKLGNKMVDYKNKGFIYENIMVDGGKTVDLILKDKLNQYRITAYNENKKSVNIDDCIVVRVEVSLEKGVKLPFGFNSFVAKDKIETMLGKANNVSEQSNQTEYKYKTPVRLVNKDVTLTFIYDNNEKYIVKFIYGI